MNLREQLAKKRAHTTTATFPIGEEGQRAAAQLQEAERDLTLLGMLEAKGQSVDKAKAEAARKKALAAYKKHSLTLTFRGLSPVEFDAINNEYAVDPDDKDAKVDMRGYTGALMAASVVDSDLTAEEWITELFESGRWSEGEVRQMRHAAQDAYSESPAPGIPKD